ncbi:MAG: hypothetical protein L6R41_004701 [Letrouitia leprolyta]|nr:MAG: hypothetical protein L6R41_004701 [Letrouitia leprolyta]
MVNRQRYPFRRPRPSLFHFANPSPRNQERPTSPTDTPVAANQEAELTAYRPPPRPVNAGWPSNAGSLGIDDDDNLLAGVRCVDAPIRQVDFSRVLAQASLQANRLEQRLQAQGDAIAALRDDIRAAIRIAGEEDGNEEEEQEEFNDDDDENNEENDEDDDDDDNDEDEENEEDDEASPLPQRPPSASAVAMLPIPALLNIHLTTLSAQLEFGLFSTREGETDPSLEDIRGMIGQEL